MRITKRNLLTVILAVLCAVAIALGVGFVMPKNNNSKIANAASGTPFTRAELDGLAINAGYANFGTLSNELSKGTTVNASKFGDYTVSFEGMDWFPVLATANGDDVILTLWLKNSIGDYTFSDGTYGNNASYGSNNYYYSWIRAAINAGNTDIGYYYGSWPSTTTSTAAPTKYSNSVKAPSASCAPTAFTGFSSIIGNSFIEKGGDYGDYLWLPTADEAKSGGSWGCTSVHWENNGTVGYCWTRSAHPSNHYYICVLDASGGTSYRAVSPIPGVRPAISVKISATVTAPTADETPKTYTGNSFSFPMTFDSSYVDITLVTGKDFNEKAISVSTADIVDGVFKASLAGTYTVTFNLKQTAIDNDRQWCDDKGGTDKRELTFTINRQGVDVPTIQNTPSTYKAEEYEFGLSGYDPAIMSVPSSGYYATNGSTITWDKTTEKFTATDADTYTVKFHLDDANYIWKTAGGESASDQSKTITINKKELTINTTPATNLSWGLNDSATLTVNASADGIDDPDFELEIYYIKGTDTTNHITTGITGTTLDISQVATSGEYKLCVALKASHAGNKNYSIANNVKEIQFTIGSGAIDYSVINWQYQSSDDAALNDLYSDSENKEQNVIRYKQSTADGSAIVYTISAYIPDGNYLSIASDYNTGNYVGGMYTYSGATLYKDGCSEVGKYYTRIVLNTDKNHVFDDDHKLNDDGTLGWYEIEWEISKGQIDSEYLNNLVKYLQYKVGATGSWQSYDPENPPEYSNGSSITVRIDPNSYRYTGLTGAEITFGADDKTIGSHPANVTFTYDSDNYENPGVGTFSWEIAKQSIKVEWTPDDWTAANGDEYQIRVLNISETLKQFIEYEYYLADPNDYSMQTELIGVDGDGLQALIDNHGVSLNNAVAIYVKVVLKNPNGQYRLVDKTGNPVDCALLYKLGSNNTIVNVKLSEKSAEYGSTTLNTGILSLIVTDGDNESELDRDMFVERIYVVDSENNEYDWDEFDFAAAPKGTYTIKIKLNEDGENDYVLSWPDGHTFEIKPKAIPVPTLSGIVFKNDFINLADYLGGSYLEYKNIITLGGTYDGVKNVGSYKATLTLTDSNYCWDYSSINTVKWLVGYSLTDNEFKEVSDTVCELSWGITPYVLKTSSWNLSGKEGAAYNLPANLIDGLEVTLNYLYYTDKVSNPLAEGESLVAGSTYFVKAELLGADANNFVFEDSKATTSDFVTYKVPKSGMAAFMGTMKDFFTKTVLGLPVWLWFVIALAVLLFLIIIIAVAKKRSKNKEERLAKKEAKEEEKRRREEERQMQREKLEAERELAKAKQEAELEKIRAQAGLGMAGIGAASMAMQQPMQQQMPVPQQQPVMAQQTVPQYQQYQQPDNGAMARIEAELAEIRMKVSQQQMQPQYYPMAQQMPMQMQGPMPMAMPMQMQGSSMVGGEYSELKAEVRSMHDEQRSDRQVDALRREMQLEFAKMRGGASNYNVPAQMPMNSEAQPVQNIQGNSAETMGAIMAAFVKNMAAGNYNLPTAEELAVSSDAQTATADKSGAIANYPPDAVITTTTTVDTTKNKPVARSREEDSNFDVDGFYDKYE